MPQNIIPTRYLSYYAARRRMAEIIVEGSRSAHLMDCAVRTVQGVGTGDYANEAQALASLCRDCVRYTGDASGEDFYKWPELTLLQKAGDCNNKVLLFGALARSIGFPVRLAFVFDDDNGMDPDRFPVHVFACVDIYKGERERQLWIPVELVPLPNKTNGFPTYTIPMGALPAGNHVIEYFDVDRMEAAA